MKRRYTSMIAMILSMAAAAHAVAAPAAFDAPVKRDVVLLPRDPGNPSATPKITCSRYPGFAVKEVDRGEVGAEKLALVATDAPCGRDGTGERVIVDDFAGYFLGVAGNFVFFTAADGWNNGLPFVVYDARTATRLFDGSYAGDGFTTVTATADAITLRFDRILTTTCTLFQDKGECAAKVSAETGLAVDRLPDCTAAYKDEIARTPDFAADIETMPSVIEYTVDLVHADGKTTVTPLAGQTACHLPS